MNRLRGERHSFYTVEAQGMCLVVGMVKDEVERLCAGLGEALKT